MSNEDKYISVARKELLNPTFAVTKQYLAVMELELENGNPKIERISIEAQTVSLYFGIKDERFYIVVNISVNNPTKPDWVWIESAHRVYLTATSEDKTYHELASYLSLTPLTGWSRGDVNKINRRPYKFSRVSFEPITNEAYGLEEKLEDLLSELMKDTDGIRLLSENSDAYVSICKYQYISGNAGIHFNMDVIKKLADLGLEVDIDTYITGNAIED
jgi:hypothetical protein